MPLPNYIYVDFRDRYGVNLGTPYPEFYTLPQISKICQIPIKDVVELAKRLNIRPAFRYRVRRSRNKRYDADAVKLIYDTIRPTRVEDESSGKSK
jgi:hypothetical protein